MFTLLHVLVFLAIQM